MLIATRRHRGRQVAGSTTERTVAALCSPTKRAWPDTLAILARAHRARLAMPDPSRPWLAPDGVDRRVGPMLIDQQRDGPMRPRHDPAAILGAEYAGNGYRTDSGG